MYPSQHQHAAPIRFAFTLVELIVVVGIILVLLAAILVAGPALINNAKTTSTKAILVQVQAMVELFEREQREHPTISRPRNGDPTYIRRYGFFPPDELELFTPAGVPMRSVAGSLPPDKTRSLAPGRAALIPAVPSSGAYGPMTYFLDRNDKLEFEHRDNAALVLAVELYGRESKSLLESISQTHQVPGPTDVDDKPLVFLDRDRDERWSPDKDLPIRYLVDSWKLPINYMAQRDWVKDTKANIPVSSNDPDWNQASTQMIRRNGSQPIIFSYGADGHDQLTEEMITSDITGEVTLIQDWIGGSLGTSNQIDHPLNADNVYANPELKDKLAEQSPSSPTS